MLFFSKLLQKDTVESCAEYLFRIGVNLEQRDIFMQEMPNREQKLLERFLDKFHIQYAKFVLIMNALRYAGMYNLLKRAEFKDV